MASSSPSVDCCVATGQKPASSSWPRRLIAWFPCQRALNRRAGDSGDLEFDGRQPICPIFRNSMRPRLSSNDSPWRVKARSLAVCVKPKRTRSSGTSLRLEGGLCDPSPKHNPTLAQTVPVGVLFLCGQGVHHGSRRCMECKYYRGVFPIPESDILDHWTWGGY